VAGGLKPPPPEASLPAGVGLAQVQAARGLLVHRVAIQAGRVADYRILAPTEWNFHPQGAAALGLATLPDADDATLRRMAGLFVTALDPCVAYDVHLD
jgi:coenzyme F420-reducing hydrogenase alpha subunit